MSLETVLGARALMGDYTPLNADCGALCAAACCRGGADGQGGMYLFPGEEALLPGKRDAFAPIYVCEGTCEREKRPLACRIFPLTPVMTDRGWSVRMDRRARPMCPLVRSGLRGLNRDFVRAARAAVRLIASEPEGEAFLRGWEAIERSFDPFG